MSRSWPRAPTCWLPILRCRPSRSRMDEAISVFKRLGANVMEHRGRANLAYHDVAAGTRGVRHHEACERYASSRQSASSCCAVLSFVRSVECRDEAPGPGSPILLQRLARLESRIVRHGARAEVPLPTPATFSSGARSNRCPAPGRACRVPRTTALRALSGSRATRWSRTSNTSPRP